MPTPKPSAGGKKFLGLSPKWWAVAVALGVLIFWYLRKQSSSTTNASNATDTTAGLDEGQLASDIAGQTTAALGGTPGADTGGFDPTALTDALNTYSQSLEDFASSFAGMTAGGVGGSTAGQTGVGSSPSAGGAQAGAVTEATGAPIIVNPQPSFTSTAPANPDNTTTDVANPATSFYPPGTLAANPSLPAPAPLYAYSSGQEVAESPIAGSVFSTSTPAAAGYQALGVQPSAPVTFVPTPETSSAPSSQGNIARPGQRINA